MLNDLERSALMKALLPAGISEILGDKTSLLHPHLPPHAGEGPSFAAFPFIHEA